MKDKSKLKDKQDKCKHEWRTFIDRTDKTKQIFCCKCGKDYNRPYSTKF